VWEVGGLKRTPEDCDCVVLSCDIVERLGAAVAVSVPGIDVVYEVSCDTISLPMAAGDCLALVLAACSTSLSLQPQLVALECRRSWPWC